jgi:hypothetical protein
MLNKLRIEESQVPKMCLDLYREYGTTMAGLKVYACPSFISSFCFIIFDTRRLRFLIWIITCYRFWGTISTTTTSMPACMGRVSPSTSDPHACQLIPLSIISKDKFVAVAASSMLNCSCSHV